MTSQKSFKRRVRARMEHTGESYAAARRQLLPKAEPEPAGPVALEQRLDDEVVQHNTGRTWSEWFALLDEWGATDRKHPEIARWLVSEHGISGWWSQSVTVAYEQARGMRQPGQRASGHFAVSVSRTIAVPVQQLFEAFVDEALRDQWLPDAPFSIRTATAPKSIRANWKGGDERVNVGFTDKGDGKSTVGLEHERLADADAAAAANAFWRERLAVLKTVLES